MFCKLSIAVPISANVSKLELALAVNVLTVKVTASTKSSNSFNVLLSLDAPPTSSVTALEMALV